MSCGRQGGEVPQPAASVYYWKTTFEITEAQRQYLEQNDIQKIYLRLFDIVPSAEGPRPNATIAFEDTIPSQLTVVPTIFIDYTIFRDKVDIDLLARRTLERVRKMSATHGFSFNEIQFDCDWTVKTEEGYFAFLKAVGLADTSMVVSSTIRLHQLSSTPPPADYGALMLYNTGDFRQANGDRNPILDADDVRPYLKHLASYDLPLCAAYPNFDWRLLFHEGEFKGILYQVDLSDTTTFFPVSPDTYTVIMPRHIPVAKGKPYLHLATGDMVKHWMCDPDEIRAVQQMVASKRKHINDQTIVYHLSAI